MPRIQHKTTGPAVSEPPKPFHPTPEQAAVLDLVKFIALNPGYGPAPGIGFIPADPKLPNTLTVVQAKPGSGKTATAVHAIKEAFLANPRLNFRLLAFNDNAATELQQIGFHHCYKYLVDAKVSFRLCIFSFQPLVQFPS